MKPKTPVKSYKCSSCGIVLVNSKELLKHQIAAHVDKMVQCQSCRNIDQSIAQDIDNDIESNLFKKTIREKKARKRTRGPYRKSVSSLPS
jgi:hypothetical protein